MNEEIKELLLGFKEDITSSIKVQLDEFRTELKSEIKSDMDEFRTELKSEIKSDMDEFRTELKSEIKSDMDKQFGQMNQRFDQNERMIEQLITMVAQNNQLIIAQSEHQQKVITALEELKVEVDLAHQKIAKNEVAIEKIRRILV